MKSIKVRAVAAVSAVLLTSTATVADAAQTYSLTVLGGLGGSYSSAQAINASGQIVGSAYLPGDTAFHATLWNGNTITDLGTLGGTNSIALDINAFGQIVGFANTSTNAPHATRWLNGSTQDIDLGGGNFYGTARAINDAGAVVGYSYRFNAGTCFSCQSVTGFARALDGSNVGSSLLDINNAGQFVGSSPAPGGGSHAAVWQNQGSLPTDLGTLGGLNSQATAINEAGQIVGYGFTAGIAHQHAILWNGTTATDLGTLGGADSFARGINNAGQIVGWSTTSNAAQHAVIWNGTTATDLNTFASGSGWELMDAYGINDSGLIVGRAFNYTMGQQRAFLLTPENVSAVPEPASLPLLLSGLGVLGAAIRRRQATAGVHAGIER